MVKNPQRPIVWIMAKPAILSQRTFMFIIVIMTGRTIGLRLLKPFAEMAGVALNLFMFPQQRETRQVMVKTRVFRP